MAAMSLSASKALLTSSSLLEMPATFSSAVSSDQTSFSGHRSSHKKQLSISSNGCRNAFFQPLEKKRDTVSPFAVSAEATSADVKTDDGEKKTTATYHFVVANAKFMLDEEEHFQEQLKERLRWLEEKGKEQDFWLCYEPTFLENFPEITKRLKRPAVALVSTNGTWMTFMRLRLDRVLKGEFECDNVDEALESKTFNTDLGPSGKWIAPYPKYEVGWWTPYVSPSISE